MFYVFVSVVAYFVIGLKQYLFKRDTLHTDAQSLQSAKMQNSESLFFKISKIKKSMNIEIR